MQVNIQSRKHDFLKHDSFVSCNSPQKYHANDLKKWINANTCRYVGNIDDEDLTNIRETIIISGLLTPNEIALYFQK